MLLTTASIHLALQAVYIKLTQEGTVGRGGAESNIARREHDISNVGRHGVEQMVCRPHKGVLID